MRSFYGLAPTTLMGVALLATGAVAAPLPVRFGAPLLAGRLGFQRPTSATLGPGVSRPSGAVLGPGLTRTIGATPGPGVPRAVGAIPGPNVERPTGPTPGPGLVRPTGPTFGFTFEPIFFPLFRPGDLFPSN